MSAKQLATVKARADQEAARAAQESARAAQEAARAAQEAARADLEANKARELEAKCAILLQKLAATMPERHGAASQI